MEPSTREQERVKQAETQRRIEDKRMIENQFSWPRWPLLPLKRYAKHELQCGFMHIGSRVTLYLRDIYSLNTIAKEGESWQDILARIPERAEYTSIEAMLDDGWMVD